MVEGSLEAKLPTISRDENAGQIGRSSDMEKAVRREMIRDGESQKREDAGARKVGKSRNPVFFQCFVAPEGRKVGSLKAAGAEVAGQISDEKSHDVVLRCGAKQILK